MYITTDKRVCVCEDSAPEKKLGTDSLLLLLRTKSNYKA